MFAEKLLRIAPEIILNQAIFWGYPYEARWIAARLGKNPYQAEEDTYELMAIKNEGLYGGDRAMFYRTKARIASFKSHLYQVCSNSI